MAGPQRPPRLAGAVGLWEGPSQLKRRIAVLLNEQFNVMRSCSRRWRGGSLVAIALMAIGLSTVTFQPQAGIANEAGEETASVESPATGKVEPATETVAAEVASGSAAAEQDPMVAYLGHRQTENKTPNVIRGRCLDEANRPIADVEVELYRGKRPNGLQRLVTQIKTNAAGEFEFRDVVDPQKSFPDGVVSANYVSNTEMFTVTTRQPGRVSREVLADAPYTYREGRSVDVLMPPAASLSGIVTDDAGKPIAGARVSRNGLSDFPHIFSGVTDAQGRFSIDDLAPFDLAAEKKRKEEEKKAADAQLAAGAQAVLTTSLAPRFSVVHPEFSSKRLPLSSVPSSVEVKLSPGARLRGRVLFADGSPSASTAVIVKPSVSKQGNGDWGMIDYGKFNIELDYQVTVQTDAEGRFEAGSLTPGKVDVWAELPGWLNAGVGEFEVKAGPAEALPDLTLTKGGVIRLQLIDDETGRPIAVDEPLVANVSVIMKNKLGRQETWPDRKKVSDQGIVEVASLPGTAQVWLQSVQAGTEQRWIPASQLWTEYPQVQVAEGQTVDAELRVRKAPAAAPVTAEDASTNAKPAAETRHQAMGQGAIVAVPLTPQQPSTENANKLAIAVVDEQGAPLPGVEALIYSISRPQGEHVLDRTVATGADGKIVADNLVAPVEVERFKKLKAEGGFIYDGSKGGYVIVLRRAGLATALLFQSPGDLALYGVNRTIKMRPAVKLSGQVTDPAGKPVAGAKVVAGDSFVGSFTVDGVNAVTTDAEGRYEFADRAPFNRAESNKNQSQFLAASLNFQASPAASAPAAAEDPSVSSVSNLLVMHPDYAVTRAEGADVPGVADVQLLPAASISGRVIHHGSGAPAAGVTVCAAGFPDMAKAVPDEMQTRAGHSAVTTTDANGAYRFSNLPAARYDVWADSGAQEMSDAPWVSRGQSRIEALPGGEPAKVPDLIIGPPAIVQVQLVDAESGESVELPAGATANLAPQRVDGPSMQQTPLQRVSTTTDGKFDMRLFPGRSRVLLFIHEGAVGTPAIWQTDDDVDSTGEVFDLQPGETISAKIKVLPAVRVNELRERDMAANKLMEEKKYAEAIAAYSSLIADFPQNHFRVLQQRGHAFNRLGDYAAALADFEASLKLAPGNTAAKFFIASLLATTPVDADRDSRRALQYAEQLAAFARKQDDSQHWLASILDIQAAAYADVSEFDKAIKIEEEAIKLTHESQRDAMKSRLELYQTNKPFRREATAPATIAPAEKSSNQGASTSAPVFPLTTKAVQLPPPSPTTARAVAVPNSTAGLTQLEALDLQFPSDATWHLIPQPASINLNAAATLGDAVK